MNTMKPVDGQLTIVDGEGTEKLCQILFTLDSEEFNKKYVVFYPLSEMDENDEDAQIGLMAASFVEGEEGMGELFEIETDAEWAMLEAAVADFEEQMDENDNCACGHHHCDDCEQDDCDDEEDHECCCHHNE